MYVFASQQVLYRFYISKDTKTGMLKQNKIKQDKKNHILALVTISNQWEYYIYIFIYTYVYMCVYIQEFKKNIKYSFIKILRNVWKILEKFKNQKIKKKLYVSVMRFPTYHLI